MKRQRIHSGFTLLELVLVMVIACTALAMAAPSLRGWGHGAKLRNAANELLMLSRLAHTESITKGVTYRLHFEQSTPPSYWLLKQQGTTFVELETNFGKHYSMPENTKLEMTNYAPVYGELENGMRDFIEFSPTGRTQPAQITMTDSQEFSIRIACVTPAQGFKIVSEGQP